MAPSSCEVTLPVSAGACDCAAAVPQTGIAAVSIAMVRTDERVPRIVIAKSSRFLCRPGSGVGSPQDYPFCLSPKSRSRLGIARPLVYPAPDGFFLFSLANEHLGGSYGKVSIAYGH
jgi:hypothetical protein